MIRFVNKSRTRLSVNGSVEGEPLQMKIARKLANKEGFDADVDLIYTEKKDGVSAGHNIKTDRFEVALDGLGKIEKSRVAKRDAKAKMKVVKEEEVAKENLGGVEGKEEVVG